MIQFLRYLPRLASLGVDAAFECPPPLLPLVQSMAGAPKIIAARNEPPDPSAFDACIPLLSLPLVVGADWAQVPASPYLRAQESRAQALAAEWRSGGRRALGIVWRASRFDNRRSTRLATMLSLASTGYQLVSLQTGLSKDERSDLDGRRVPDAGTGFRDFGDSAAAIAALDKIITVDTATAHLAGALGKPTWLLLSEPAATRWMLEREDSPWYPSMRLFRKPGDSPWEVLFERLALELDREAF